MKKLMRLLAAVLVLTMLCEMLPLAAFAQSDIGQAVTAAVQGIEEENSIAASGTCGENLTWTLDSDGLLTVSGTGTMDYGDSSKIWTDKRDEVKTAVLKPGVTSIGFAAFNACVNLTNITIPESVTSIEAVAFGDCTALKSVVLPAGITKIDDYTFSGCTELEDITLPVGVTSIGKSAFNGCKNLTSIMLPESVTSIGEIAFGRCGLTDITIPEGVTRIEPSAFWSSSLTSIALPKSVTSIGKNAFEDCNDLISITLPENVTCVEYGAFLDCKGLTSITLPVGVTKIEVNAFFGCKQLTDVYYDGTKEQWNDIDIGKNNDPLINATIHYQDGELNQKRSFEFGTSKGTTGDNYSFINTGKSFFTDDELPPENLYTATGIEAFWYESIYPEYRYQISSSKLDQLIYGLNPADRTYVKQCANRWWTGSCQGMAVSAMLHYIAPERLPLSQIPLSQKDSTVSSIYNMKMPKESAEVKNLINYYHLTQDMPSFNDFVGERGTYSKEHTEEAVNDIISNLKDGKPVFAGLGTHAILLVGYQDEDDEAYIVSVYDPNVSGESSLFIYKDSSSKQYIHIEYTNGDNHDYDSIVYYITASEQDMKYLDLRSYFGIDDHETAAKKGWAMISYPVDAVIDLAYANKNTNIRGWHYTSELLQFFVRSADEALEETSKETVQATFPMNEDNSFTLNFTPVESGQVTLNLDGILLAISAKKPVTLQYNDTTKTIDVTANDKTDVALLVTEDEQSDSWPWNSWAVKTVGTTTLHAELDSEGLHLTGDGLTNAKYATENADTEQTSKGTINVQPDETGKTSVTIINKNDGDTDDTEVKGEDKAEETTYTVTVNGGTASPAKAKEGETVTIIAEKTDTFQNWTVVAGGITLENENLPTTTFTMGKENVVITAVKGEDKAEETTYTVTVSGGTASPAKAKEGETVTITAEKTDTFQNWTVVAGGITLENENLPTTTFTMDKENVVITANYSSGGNITPPSPGEPGQSPSDDGGAGIVLAIGAAATVAAGIGAIALMPVKVEGKVELADHTALPGAKIALLQNGKVVAQTTTDANGKFALKVKRGSYELTAAYTDANGQLMHKTASFKAPAKNLTVTF